MSTQRYYDGADGARPEHGVLARREYGLLALEDTAGDPAAAGPQGSGDNPKDTTGIGGTDGRETGAGERNGRRMPLVRGQPEKEEED